MRLSRVGSALLAGLMLAAFGHVAIASAETSPVIAAVTPASGPNDIDTSVTITGTGFATDTSGTASPIVLLGREGATSTPIPALFVTDATLTAQVPWGMDPATYTVTVGNPDGATGSLPDGFTVTRGLGEWNGGTLYGGLIDQLMMRPRDPSTIYALSYGIMGLFRSDDAGATWKFVSDQAWANNNRFVVDPYPGHEDWIYCYSPGGIKRSTDKGETWPSPAMNPWGADEPQIFNPQVYVSPDTSGTLFASSASDYGGPDSAHLGLAKSTDGGANWTVEPSMVGTPVQDIAFDPANAQHVALATSDARVFLSDDGGGTWHEVAKPPVGHLWFRGSIQFNPYRPGEVWLDAPGPADSPTRESGIFKSHDAAVTSWDDVSPPDGGVAMRPAFGSADDVYVTRWHSRSDGATGTWEPWGPSPWYGYGGVCIDADATQTIYIADDDVGVRKSTDGGSTFDVSNQGLAGLVCGSLDVSAFDPLRLYAVCNGPLGIFRSYDGAQNWEYRPIDGSFNVRQVLADPQNAERVYAVADTGFYVSSDEGGTWPGGGTWSSVLGTSAPGMPVAMAADPDPAHPGHVLVTFGNGMYGLGAGWLYSTDDSGAHWHEVTVTVEPLRSTDITTSALQWMTDVEFDRAETGTVYLTTKGTGVYKSVDHGETWSRVDDPAQPDMAYCQDLAIATTPQHVVMAGNSYTVTTHFTPRLYRSLDGGSRWTNVSNALAPGGLHFANGDSARLYSYGLGLSFSSDLGDTWELAAGALGQLQVMALDSSVAGERTILYAATPGGSAQLTGGIAKRPGLASLTAASATLVDAGVYRRVQGDTDLAITAPKRTTTIGYAATTTIRGTLTSTGHGLGSCSVRLESSSNGVRWSGTGKVSVTTTTGAFSFSVAPTTRTYYRVRFGSTALYIGSTSGSACLLPHASLAAPSTRSTMSRRLSYAVYGYMKPLHRGTSAVRIYRYRIVHGKPVLYGTYVKAYAAYYRGYTKYTATVRLPYTGKWQLRARAPADSGHADTWSGYKNVRVF